MQGVQDGTAHTRDPARDRASVLAGAMTLAAQPAHGQEPAPTVIDPELEVRRS